MKVINMSEKKFNELLSKKELEISELKSNEENNIRKVESSLKEEINSLESFFKQVKNYNPKIIAKEIANKFKNEIEKDDVSVIVIKLDK